MISKEQFLELKHLKSLGVPTTRIAQKIGISVPNANKWLRLDEEAFDNYIKANTPYYVCGMLAGLRTFCRQRLKSMRKCVIMRSDKEKQGADTRQMMKQVKKRKIWIVVIAALLILALVWVAIRHSATVKCTAFDGDSAEPYSESEKVFAAMSLSYLVYGCEGCEGLTGTVGDILDTQKMGIIIENADISRTVKDDPTTAMIDSASFIRQTVGSYRFITDLKDEKNSFYGACFADDENNVVWLSFSGSVSFADAVQSSLLVVGAGLSGQEKRAFELYETVLKTDELQNGYYLILTGHSLGGALASMVAYMSGAEAVTISGADGLALSKIRSIESDISDSCRITNYLTSPDGFGFSLKDCVQRMMFWGDYDGVTCHTYEDNDMADNSHSVFGFVRFEDGDRAKPILP